MAAEALVQALAVEVLAPALVVVEEALVQALAVEVLAAALLVVSVALVQALAVEVLAPALVQVLLVLLLFLYYRIIPFCRNLYRVHKVRAFQLFPYFLIRFQDVDYSTTWNVEVSLKLPANFSMLISFLFLDGAYY